MYPNPPWSGLTFTPSFMAVSKGDLIISGAIPTLTGAYLSDTGMNDGNSNTKFAAFGSLLTTGAGSSINFTRTFTVTPPAADAPAELWSYNPGVLDLYKNVVARPKFRWQELPPD